MDEKAIELVRKYIFGNVFMPENKPLILFITWKAKILQNWKYLIAGTLRGWYFEVTYNGDKEEWYLDVYKKVDNQKVSIVKK